MLTLICIKGYISLFIGSFLTLHLQCVSVTLRICYSIYGTFKLTYIFAVDQNKPPVQNINIFGGQVVIGDDGAIHQEGIYHRIF